MPQAKGFVDDLHIETTTCRSQARIPSTKTPNDKPPICGACFRHPQTENALSGAGLYSHVHSVYCWVWRFFCQACQSMDGSIEAHYYRVLGVNATAKGTYLALSLFLSVFPSVALSKSSARGYRGNFSASGTCVFTNKTPPNLPRNRFKEQMGVASQSVPKKDVPVGILWGDLSQKILARSMCPNHPFDPESKGLVSVDRCESKEAFNPCSWS